MSKHPNLTPGFDMILFTKILVDSNPEVFVLFFCHIIICFLLKRVSLYLVNLFVGVYLPQILYMWLFVCFVTSWFLINFIEFIPLIRSFSILVFPMTWINIPHSLAPDILHNFCVYRFLWFSMCLNSRTRPS